MRTGLTSHCHLWADSPRRLITEFATYPSLPPTPPPTEARVDGRNHTLSARAPATFAGPRTIELKLVLCSLSS